MGNFRGGVYDTGTLLGAPLGSTLPPEGVRCLGWASALPMHNMLTPVLGVTQARHVTE